MAKARSGYIQQLPSGAFRVSVYAGTDPLTGRQIRLRRTCKTERAAQIELGRLLEQAAAGRQPETDATVAQLMDRYAEVADWDLSTRKANEYYIQRVIKPALGHLQVRKIRGPLLDLLYAQLRRCGDHACTGKPFTEHRNAPILTVDPASGQPAWQQVVNAIGDAIRCGVLPPGEPLPSVREMSTLQGVPVATLQHALAVLADERLLVVRQGRTAVVAGDAGPDRRPGRAPRDRDHDCRRAGCKPHVCRPMTAKTIRNIHSILSGAFATAKRWEPGSEQATFGTGRTGEHPQQSGQRVTARASDVAGSEGSCRRRGVGGVEVELGGIQEPALPVFAGRRKQGGLFDSPGRSVSIAGGGARESRGFEFVRQRLLRTD